MARKKTITKDQILKAAYEVVATEGFSRFTARNIANKMKCSTQPIYLEFKNMDDLKDALLEKLYDYLATEVFAAQHDHCSIVNLALNYIHFAEKENQLYRSLYLEDSGGGKRMHEFSSEYFRNIVQKDPKYKDLDTDQIESLNMGCWIVATGIASLMSSSIIRPSDEQITALIEDTIESILSRDVRISV